MALLFIVLGSRVMTPLTWRVVNLKLFLAWRIPIVLLLFANWWFLSSLLVLSSLWRSLWNLSVQACLMSSFFYFLAKCFFFFSNMSVRAATA